jgi:hypothetical protein
VDLARYVEQVHTKFDWPGDGMGDDAVAGMSGNKAALILAGEMAAGSPTKPERA